MSTRLLLRVIIGLVVIGAMLVSPVKAEEFRLSVTLQEFSGTNVQQRFIEAMRDPKSIASVVETLEPGKVHFSQSINVADDTTLDETIVLGSRTVKFRCELGKAVGGKVSAALSFEIHSAPGEKELFNVSLSTRTDLKVGQKSYLGGAAGDKHARFLVLELTELQKE